jgi:uncharacterized membrane protein
MILYHFCWDLVYIAGFGWRWFSSSAGFVWQQSICWSFILISGFCAAISHHQIRRGLIVSLCGLTITAVTSIFLPEDIVIFGILTFLGAAMITTGLFRMLPVRIPSSVGLYVCTCLFILTRFISQGYIGIWTHPVLFLPKIIYANLITTFFGFMHSSFYSTDYFSFFPWIFLYMCGYYTADILQKKNITSCKLFRINIPFFSYAGRHSLFIYMLHQPILYLITLLLDACIQ